MRILTIDLGSTSLKAILWERGRAVRETGAPLTLATDGDRAEQDAAEWWTRAAEAVRALRPGAVDGIAATAQMHAVVAVDAAGIPLARVPVVMDRRARLDARELGAALGWPAIHRATGGRLDATAVLPKLRHLTRSAGGAAWRAARWLLPPKDYIRFRLTGRAATDPIDAAGTLMWDPQAMRWIPELAAEAGCRLEQLPPLQPTLSVAGPLAAAAASELGMPAGVPVVTCGGDDIESLGAGVFGPGDAFEHLGTTGSIYLASDRWSLDPAGRVETYPDVVHGRWLMGASTTTAGAALDWARRVLGGGEAGAPLLPVGDAPGDILFLPFLAGERGPWWDDSLSAAWLGLRASHAAADLRRAVAEGVLFSLRSLFDCLRLFGAGPGTRVCTSGPLGADERGARARADLYGCPVQRLGSHAQTTSSAAAIIAEAALAGGDVFELARRRLPLAWRCEPGNGARDWEAGFARYRSAAEAAARGTHGKEGTA